MNYSTENILAVVLAAGKGTRMKSDKPKVLHEIFNVPLLGWVLRALDNIKSIVVIGHQAELIEEYLKKFPNTSCVLQKNQLGTGHALMCAEDKLKNFKGDLLVLCGDTPLITKETILNFVKFHTRSNAPISVMTAIIDEPFGYGRIIRDKVGNVQKIVEQKDATQAQAEITEINTGIYLINWQIISPMLASITNTNSQGEYYLTDIVAKAFENNLIPQAYCIKDSTEVFGINSRKNLSDAQEIMNKKHLNFLMNEGVTVVDTNTTFISPETLISADTTVFPCTYIEGKNIIGNNCKIGPMTHIRGGCTVGNNCKIGNFVELKNAKIANNTNVAHLTYIGDATLGSDINIGAGTIFANYNSITKEKNHTFLHDGVSIGSNSVLVSPVELKENAFVAAGSVITKDVEKDSLAIARAQQKEIKNWIRSRK